jgi:hypothetical protein
VKPARTPQREALWHRPWPKLPLLLPVLLLLLGGCVVVPQTRQVYDPACGVATRQITLEVAVLPGFHHCQGDGCVALMVTAGVVTVASAVVSGSVAVVGNVLYWAERQAGCPRPGGVPLPSLPKG